jgi:type I restriction enzyme S subunit
MGSVLNEVFGEMEEKYVSKSIETFSKVGTGVTPLKSKSEYYDNGNINWITSRVTNKEFVYEAEQLITNTALDECRLKMNPIGTLIVALYGQGKTRGQVSELRIESATNQAIATIIVDDKQSINIFLKYFLKKSYLDLRDLASGGTQPNLNLSIIKAIKVPIPPLQIQQKVVNYLDSVSQKMDKLKSIQKEKMESLKALRASILDRALGGVVMDLNAIGIGALLGVILVTGTNLYIFKNYVMCEREIVSVWYNHQNREGNDKHSISFTQTVRKSRETLRSVT